MPVVHSDGHKDKLCMAEARIYWDFSPNSYLSHKDLKVHDQVYMTNELSYISVWSALDPAPFLPTVQ